MSIYTRCAKVVEELRDRGEVFTELDVVHRALDDNPIGETMREASNLCGRLYREGRLCRYGPIEMDGLRDYARIATKIVYADADSGPASWETPNGDFPKLLFGSDAIARQRGRRNGTNRDDRLPWKQTELATLRDRIERYERRLEDMGEAVRKVRERA